MSYTNHTDSVELLVEKAREKFKDLAPMGHKVTSEEVDFASQQFAYMWLLPTLQANQSQQVEEAVRKRNGVIKEYKDEGVMFVLKVEDGKTYEASMPIPKWAEVGKLTLRDHEHDWVPCPGTVCTSDLHTHHCSICRKHAYQPVTPHHQD